MKLLKEFFLLVLVFLPLVLFAQTTITSDPAGTNNWNLTTTWVGGIVPVTANNVVIAANHTVTVNATSTIANLLIDGILNYGTTATPLTVTGNLTVSFTGTLNAYNGTTGKTMNVAGNITNNGSIDFSKTSSVLALNGAAAQTVSGSGTLTNNTIASLTFNNTATSPTINWQWSDVIVSATLSITKGLINLGATNSMTVGTSVTSPGTLSLPATLTTGFTSGKYVKWFGLTGAGSAFAVNTNPAVTPTEGRMPFMSANAQCRHLMWNRTAGTGTGGKISCIYTDVSTISTVNFMDGTYSIDRRTDFNWVLSNEGTTPSGTNINILVYGTGAFVPITASVARIVGAASALPGATQNGVVTPHFTPRRTGFSSWTDLTATPLHIGLNKDDLPFTTKQDGSWTLPSTWQDDVVPNGQNYVLISHNVTVSSGTNLCRNLTVGTGGTLTQTGGTLSTVGVDYNNVVLASGGTLDIQGGELNVLGKLQLSGVANSILKQSGGSIIVDGNSGSALSSTPTNIVDLSCSSPTSLQLTGGTMTIVDPPAVATYNAFKVYISVGAAFSASNNWTLKLGNGTSTDAGALNTGFLLNLTGATYKYGLGNVVVDIENGSNRYVTTSGSIPLNNLTITKGEYRANSAHFISGNIENSGTLVSLSTLTFSTYNGTAATTGTVAQTIGGTTGVFTNSTGTATANFIGLSINNTGGVTLNKEFNMSGLLTLTNGLLRTSTASLLTLETTSTVSPAGGQASSYVNGPIAKKTASTTAFTFPTGKNAIYRKVTLTPSSTTASTYTAEFFDTPYAIQPFTAPIEAVHSKEYFDLSGTNPAKVGLTYDLPSGFASNTADLSVAHFTGGSWINEAATATTTGIGVVTTTADVTTWSPFAVGSINAVNSPLPITLKSFTANENGTTNTVHWETGLEQDIRQFIVEKSTEAKFWNQLGITTPNSTKRYSLVDENPTSTTYYRLRNIDTDGKENTSSTIVVNRKLSHFTIINIAPNPTTADINVKFEVEKNTNIIITIVDAFGKTILNQVIEANKGFNSTIINTNEFPVGTYFMNINNGEKILVSKILKN